MMKDKLSKHCKKGVLSPEERKKAGVFLRLFVYFVQELPLLFYRSIVHFLYFYIENRQIICYT